jgi:hypothetical protein
MSLQSCRYKREYLWGEAIAAQLKLLTAWLQRLTFAGLQQFNCEIEDQIIKWLRREQKCDRELFSLATLLGLAVFAAFPPKIKKVTVNLSPF